MTRLSRGIAAAAAAGGLALAGTAAWLSSGEPGPAPAVLFTTVKGEIFSTRDLRGKVVLVNFWATDCVPCMREMPKLVATHGKYRSLGLETVAVAMSYDVPSRVIDYAERHKLPFKVALDVQGQAARSFGRVSVTPTTFLIDKRGTIVKRYRGEPDFAELQGLLEKKLDEPA